MDSYQTAQDIRDAVTLIRCTIDHAAECGRLGQGEESLHCDMGTESIVMAEVANRLETLLMGCELCGDERLLEDINPDTQRCTLCDEREGDDDSDDFDLEIQRCEPCTER